MQRDLSHHQNYQVLPLFCRFIMSRHRSYHLCLSTLVVFAQVDVLPIPRLRIWIDAGTSGAHVARPLALRVQ